MKKEYIKPELNIEKFELDNLMALETSQGGFSDEEGDGFVKERDNTGDSSWGDLW